MDNKIVYVSIIIIALSLLSACQDEEVPTAAPTAAPVIVETEPSADATAIPEPTEPPTEEPTAAPEPTDTAETGAVPDIVGIPWQWQQFSDTAEQNDILVPNPENYTLTLLPDGTAALQADCNQVQVGYMLENSSLSFDMTGPTTLAFCGEESLDSQYLDLLAEVVTYVIDQGKLVLNLRADAGNMIFDDVEPAGPESPVEGQEILNTTWQWERFSDTAGLNDIDVPNPGNYTLMLLSDGTAALEADCNQVQVSYTLDGSSLSFDMTGPTTLAFCGEESLDSQYLALLGDVASYVTEDGRLVLNLMADAGNMIFSRAGVGFDPSQISLDTQDLPISWQAVVVPATPYDESSPPGPKGLPEHIQILFGVTNPADRQIGDPIMTIIPVTAYEQMWSEAGNDSLATTIEEIWSLTAAIPSPAPISGLPALPFEETPGVNDLAAQLGRAAPTEDSASKNGYRFVGRWGQSPNPVTNENLRYVYQGFTNDGQFLVSFFYPVSTHTLPDDAEGVTDSEMGQVEADSSAYMAVKALMLNDLASEQWQPDLATLDALVGSLQIEGMTPNGLADSNWQWAFNVPSTGADFEPIENTERYQVTYNADGTLAFTADCNSGGGSYTLDPVASGLLGGLRSQVGPVTLAECEPGSRSEEMANGLVAAQEYRVYPGASRLDLVSPAGGPVMVFVKPGAVVPVPETGGRPAGEDVEPESAPPDLIELALQGLASSYEWEVTRAVVPETGGPGTQAFPSMILLTFDGEDPEQVLAEGGRRMYIFPTVAYFNVSANVPGQQEQVAQQVQRLQELIDSADGRVGLPDSPMPLLPPPSSFMDRWAQFLDLDFTQGRGVRYVSDSPNRQSIGPWINTGTHYYYQGLTADNRYYVSLIWPVSTDSLPTTLDGVPPEVRQQTSTDPEAYQLYLAETKDRLNALPPSAWAPDLALLDAMVASLSIQSQPQ